MEKSDDEGEDEDETEWKTTFTDPGRGLNRPQTPGVSHNTAPQWPGERTAAQHRPQWSEERTAAQHRPPVARGGVTRRVILHMDLDCFYAQVEMLRDPSLRSLPLGVQQKTIVVTCNYVAREHGVAKLMSVVDAKEKCPRLVLVRGEDLTHYRDMSYKVTELLMSFCPLVERLGLDENFVDVTEMVDKRLTRCSAFEGHVYNRSGVETTSGSRDDQRLAVGSRLAAELRAAVCGALGLTGCTGVASNKLLAKLVSGTFKPNQQTTLLPGDVDHILGHLGDLRRLPGVGHQTSKRLQALGLVSVQDLQLFPLADLVKEFGASTGQRLKNLSLGVDESPVTPSGPPQSLSDEDSFKKISTPGEVVEKSRDLLSSLVERMQKDGRRPQTLRLTIRRFSADNKWMSRESRQGPIPPHVGHKVTSGSGEAVAHLVTMAMTLFHKMVAGGAAFHLTLLNVCFSNLLPRGPADAIASFFTPRGPAPAPGSRPPAPRTAPGPLAPPQTQREPPASRGSCGHVTGWGEGGGGGGGGEGEGEGGGGAGGGGGGGGGTQHTCLTTQHDLRMTTPAETAVTETDQRALAATKSAVVSAPETLRRQDTMPSDHRFTTGGGGGGGGGGGEEVKLPPNVDPEVFRELPEDIRRELLSPTFIRTPRPPASSSSSSKPAWKDVVAPAPPSLPAASQLPSPSPGDARHQLPGGVREKEEEKKKSPTDLRSADVLLITTAGGGRGVPPGTSSMAPAGYHAGGGVPGDVDPTVFSELPPDVQRELMAAWSQQKPALKAPPSSSSSVRPQRKSFSKDKKAGVRGSRQNDLYKYFKPG